MPRLGGAGPGGNRSICDMNTDEELMMQAAEGDMDAFERLVRRHQHAALGVAFAMLSDEHAAADLVQEAFLRILEKAGSYRPSAKFTTYFYSVLRRICIDHYRKKTPDLRPDFSAEKADADSPVEILIHNEESARIHDALAKLPARQRMALTLKHFGQMSYKDIAATMGCSTAAVDSLLIRARDRLKSLLSDE